MAWAFGSPRRLPRTPSRSLSSSSQRSWAFVLSRRLPFRLSQFPESILFRCRSRSRPYANTVSAPSLAFTSSNAAWCSLLPLRRKSLSGLTIIAKSGTNRRYHDATPRYCRKSLTVDGGSCVHKHRFLNSTTHESCLCIQPQSLKWWQLNSGYSI